MIVDDFELRFRSPSIHAMSHDGDVAFLAAIPHDKHPEYVKDEGSLIISRSDPVLFRQLFLQLVEKNDFRKTTVAEFLALNRPTTFNMEGTYLEENWFLKDRIDMRETDPEKIMILIPAEWLHEAKAIKKFKARSERRRQRKAEAAKTKNFEIPKPSRPPNLNTIKEMSLGSFSNQIDLYSPLVEKKPHEENSGEVGNIAFGGFNNPANQGSLSFHDTSFEEI